MAITKKIYDSLYGVAVYGTDLYGSLYENITAFVTFNDKFIRRIFGYTNEVNFTKQKIMNSFCYTNEVNFTQQKIHKTFGSK